MFSKQRKRISKRLFTNDATLCEERLMMPSIADIITIGG
jgi:hypothetical protein